MRKAAAVFISLAVICQLFLWGCGRSDADNQNQLNSRIVEYHNVLLNITEKEKIDNNTYIARLLEYLDPLKQEATYRAIFLQNQWFRQNLDARERNQQIEIVVDKVLISDDGENALVNVTVIHGSERNMLTEKWVKVDKKWRRTVEYPY